MPCGWPLLSGVPSGLIQLPNGKYGEGAREVCPVLMELQRVPFSSQNCA